jgi:hypothetical protein
VQSDDGVVVNRLDVFDDELMVYVGHEIRVAGLE